MNDLAQVLEARPRDARVDQIIKLARRIDAQRRRRSSN